jgi:hypothetical protein
VEPHSEEQALAPSPAAKGSLFIGTIALAGIVAASWGTLDSPDGTGLNSPVRHTAAACSPGRKGIEELILPVQGEYHLSEGAARARLAAERAATCMDARARADIGEPFAGSWYLPGDPLLNVGITDPAAADRVRALGAKPVIVPRSERDLAQYRALLVLAKDEAPESTIGWYGDPQTGQVVILTGGDRDEALKFAEKARVDPALVRVEVLDMAKVAAAGQKIQNERDGGTVPGVSACMASGVRWRCGPVVAREITALNGKKRELVPHIAELDIPGVGTRVLVQILP